MKLYLQATKIVYTYQNIFVNVSKQNHTGQIQIEVNVRQDCDLVPQAIEIFHNYDLSKHLVFPVIAQKVMEKVSVGRNLCFIYKIRLTIY